MAAAETEDCPIVERGIKAKLDGKLAKVSKQIKTTTNDKE